MAPAGPAGCCSQGHDDQYGLASFWAIRLSRMTLAARLRSAIGIAAEAMEEVEDGGRSLRLGS